MEADAIHQGSKIDHSYANFAARRPEFTVTESIRHLNGHTPLFAKPRAPLVMLSAHNATPLVFVPYEGSSCQTNQATLLELRSLVDAIYAPIADAYAWRRITISMHLIPPDTGLAREIYRVSPGRSIELSFNFRCAADQPDHDVFKATLTGVHETTHAMLSLMGLDNGAALTADSLANEQIAEGGVACVYEQLAAGEDPRSLDKLYPEQMYFAVALEIGPNSPLAMHHRWCQHWIDAFSPKQHAGNRSSPLLPAG